MATTHSKLSPLTWTALALTIVGALNWGLIGLLKFDLVAAIFGNMSTLSRIVYTLVGLSGAYLIGDAVRLREDRHVTVGHRREVLSS